MLGTQAVLERVDNSRFSRRQAGLLGIVAVCLLVALAALIGAPGDSAGKMPERTSSGLEIAPGAPGTDAGKFAPGLAPGEATAGGGVGSAGSSDAGASSGFSSPQTQSSAALSPLADLTRIIQTGDVSLEVAKGGVGPTVAKLDVLATSLSGRVASSKSSSVGDNPFASITLRVPVAKYGQAITQISALGRVLQSNSSGEDVTAQYTDQTARLHALVASRATYLTLLSKANNIGEVLSVQQRIDGVQQQIESLQGQLKVLADRSDLSTITVNISEKGAQSFVTPTERTGINKAFHDGIHNFNAGVERIIAGAGTVLLLLVVLAVILGAVKLGRRFAKS